MFAHIPVELGEGGQVKDFTVANLVAHARVPAVKGHDKTNNTATAVASYGIVSVVLVVGNKVWAILGSLGTHGDMAELAHTDFQSGVDFGGVEISVNTDQGCFSLRLETGLGNEWDGKCACSDVHAQEFIKVTDGFDCLKIELVPNLQIADVPPRMHLMASSKDKGMLRDEMNRGILAA